MPKVNEMSEFTSSIVKKIEEISLPIIEARNAFLIDVKVRGSREGKIIEIFIDNDDGITTEICAEISRDINKKIDLGNLFYGKYFLVVSSPGTDRSLKYLRQYPKHIGRYLKVVYNENGVKKVFEGKLTGVMENSINITNDKQEVITILHDNILEAKVYTVI